MRQVDHDRGEAFAGVLSLRHRLRCQGRQRINTAWISRAIDPLRRVGVAVQPERRIDAPTTGTIGERDTAAEMSIPNVSSGNGDKRPSHTTYSNIIATAAKHIDLTHFKQRNQRLALELLLERASGNR